MGTLVGGQGVDDLVELALQHAIELVQRESDPVVLSARPPPFTWSRRWRESSSARRSCSSFNSRDRSTVSALARFWIWLFSSCMATTRPVGRWVMRTAESVVFTDWPPGPVDR
jgi:hypothetical protein